MNKRKLGAAVLLLALGLGSVQTSQNYNLKLNNLAYAEEAGEEFLKQQVENHYNEITSRKVYKIATDKEIEEFESSYNSALNELGNNSNDESSKTQIENFLNSDFEFLGSTVVSQMSSRNYYRTQVAILKNLIDTGKLGESDVEYAENLVDSIDKYLYDRNKVIEIFDQYNSEGVIKKLSSKYNIDLRSIQPDDKQLSAINYKGGYPDDVTEDVLSMDTSVEEYMLMAQPLIEDAQIFFSSASVLDYNDEQLNKYSQAKDELESAVEAKSENLGSAIENIKAVRKELGLDRDSDDPEEPTKEEKTVSKEDIEESKKLVAENKKDLSSILKVIDNMFLIKGKDGENLAKIFNKASDDLQKVLASDNKNPGEFLKAIESYKKAFENITKYIDENYNNKSVKELKEYAEKKIKESDNLFTEDNLKKVSNDDKADIDKYKQNKEKLEKLLKEENVDKDKLVSAIIDFEASAIDLKKAIIGDIDKLVKEYEEVKKSDTYKNASEEKKNAYDKALEEFKKKEYKTDEELEAAKAKMEEAKKALSENTELEKEIESVLGKHSDFINTDNYRRATASYQNAYKDAYKALTDEKTKENLDKLLKAKKEIDDKDFVEEFKNKADQLESYIDKAKSDKITEESLKKLKEEYKKKLQDLRDDKDADTDDIKALEDEFNGKLNPEKAEPGSIEAKDGDKKKTTKKVVTSSKKSNGKVRTGVDAILPVVGGVAIVAAIGLIFTRRKNK